MEGQCGGLSCLIIIFGALVSSAFGSLELETVQVIDTMSLVLGIRGINVVCPREKCTKSALKSSEVVTKRLVHDASFLDFEKHIEESFAFVLDKDNHGHLEKLIVELLSSERGYQHAVGSTWLVLGSSTHLDEAMERVQEFVRVNQKVLFVDMASGQVTEAYNMVKKNVLHNVGKLSLVDGKVRYSQMDHRNWLQRHSNLMGQELNGLMVPQIPYLIIPEATRLKTSNESVMVTHRGSRMREITNEIILGLFKEVLVYLEVNLNFTSRLWLSQAKSKHSFGTKYNGTWNGMIGHMVNGEGDFIGTSLTQTAIRFEAVKFAQPVATETLALFVPYQGFDQREWLAFLYPLTPGLWTLLLGNTILLLLIFKALEFYYFGPSVAWRRGPWLILVDVVSDFWMLGTAYFGRTPEKKFTSKQEAIRIVLLVTYLTGNLVFMSYKASLTAALSVKKLSLPFDSIDSLMDSEVK